MRHCDRVTSGRDRAAWTIWETCTSYTVAESRWRSLAGMFLWWEPWLKSGTSFRSVCLSTYISLFMSVFLSFDLVWHFNIPTSLLATCLLVIKSAYQSAWFPGNAIIVSADWSLIILCQDLMDYCAVDVKATHEVFASLWPQFKER